MGGSVYWVRALSTGSRAFFWMGGSGQTRCTGTMIQQAPYDTIENHSFTWLQKWQANAAFWRNFKHLTQTKEGSSV